MFAVLSSLNVMRCGFSLFYIIANLIFLGFGQLVDEQFWLLEMANHQMISHLKSLPFCRWLFEAVLE